MFVQCELNNFNRFNFLFYVLVDFEMNPKKKNCYINIVYWWVMLSNNGILL